MRAPLKARATLDSHAGEPVAAPSLWLLARVVAQISLTSFGGGVTGWMLREFVQERRWLTEDEFLTDLAMAQALPGVNVVNLPIWIGYRLRGAAGALVSAVAVILPAAAVLAAIAMAFLQLSRFPSARLALQGAAAAAIGLSLATGLQAARRVARRAQATAFMAATFVAVGVLKLPMVPVMLVLAPLSIGLSAWERRHA